MPRRQSPPRSVERLPTAPALHPRPLVLSFGAASATGPTARRGHGCGTLPRNAIFKPGMPRDTKSSRSAYVRSAARTIFERPSTSDTFQMCRSKSLRASRKPLASKPRGHSPRRFVFMAAFSRSCPSYTFSHEINSIAAVSRLYIVPTILMLPLLSSSFSRELRARIPVTVNSTFLRATAFTKLSFFEVRSPS